MDVIVAFAFTAPADLHCNHTIARRAENLAWEYKIPIVTQREVPIKINGFEVFFIKPEKYGKHFSTLAIIKGLKKLAETKGWKSVLVIAAPPHIKRCIRDLRRMGFIVEEDEFLQYYPASVWFEEDASSFFTRNPYIWWIRETLIRLMPWWLYQIIAG